MKFRKCENCGKNEVSFHFKSNVNGNVTERHLCSECASKMGALGMGPGGLLGDILGDFFGGARGVPQFDGFGMMIPAFVMPGFGFKAPPAGLPGQIDMDNPGVAAPGVTIDNDLRAKLEINKLRAQMQRAAQEEDFERAAQIRDTIARLERAPSEAKEEIANEI
jgi:protein arginine kinase activator